MSALRVNSGTHTLQAPPNRHLFQRKPELFSSGLDGIHRPGDLSCNFARAHSGLRQESQPLVVCFSPCRGAYARCHHSHSILPFEAASVGGLFHISRNDNARDHPFTFGCIQTRRGERRGRNARRFIAPHMAHLFSRRSVSSSNLGSLFRDTFEFARCPSAYCFYFG